MSVRYGHIKLSRKQMDGRDLLWDDGTPFDTRSAWVHLLFLAAWRPSDYRTGMRVDRLERGEFVASLRYLGERWQWGKNRVARFLKMLEKSGRITGQRTGQHGTVYLIVNYDSYQSTPDEGGTVNGTQSGKQTGHLRDKVEAVKQESSAYSAPQTDRPDAWVDPFAVEWERRIGMAPKPKIALLLRPLIERHGVPQVYAVWQGYVREAKGQKWGSPRHFAETYLAIRERWGTTSDTAGHEFPIPDQPGCLALEIA